jgi:hypothetical protein
LGFQLFCGESTKPQGLISFFNLLNNSFNIIPATHDFNFLRTVHHILGEDNRFGLLDFLSSDTFFELRDLLLTIGGERQDEELVRSQYHVLGVIPHDDMMTLGNWLKDFGVEHSQSSAWFRSAAIAWSTQTYDEKFQLVELLGLLTHPDHHGSSMLDLGYRIISAFPQLAPTLAFRFTQPSYRDSILYLLENLNDPNIQADIAGFLSDKGLFEFIKIITWSSSEDHKRSKETDRFHELETSLVVQPSPEITAYQNRSCFNQLAEQYKKNVNYYQMVNGLPDDCLAVLGEVGLIGQTFLWMYHSHQYFALKHGVDDFHGGIGVWSPGMLHFFFTAALKANQVLTSSTGTQGLLLNLEALHRVTTAPDLLEAFHQFTNLYVVTAKAVEFEPRLQNYIERKSNHQLNAFSSDLFSLFVQHPSRISFETDTISCHNVSDQMGATPCLSQAEIKHGLLEILRLLKNKNDTTSLLQEMVRWLHPEGGIPLPGTSSKGSKRHVTNLDEIIRFLYDLSSPSTAKQFIYNTENTSLKLDGTIIDRLEIVLRDIAFVNNFYGAHFKNDISRAIDYRSAVMGNQKLLTWLDRTSGIMRRLGFLPYDTRWRLKNVRNTYWSLVEVSDDFPQRDGTTRSYDDFIQSLLVAAVNSSPELTQNFNPYRIPHAAIVEGHRGIFLTKVTELSGLRHMAQFARSRFGDLSVLNTPEFKQIDSQLIARHELTLIQRKVQQVLDLYLDGDRNQINQMVDNFITYLSRLNDQEIKQWEELLVKTALLLSDAKMSVSNVQRLSGFMEIGIKVWPELVEMLLQIERPYELLNYLNQSLDSWLASPEALNNTLTFVLDSQAISQAEFEGLMADAVVRKQMVSFINQLVVLKLDKSLNWNATLRLLLSHHDVKWNPLIDWLEHAMDRRPPQKLTLSLLLTVLGEKNDSGYRMKSILDEVLVTRRQQLEQFLLETFPSLQLKSN